MILTFNGSLQVTIAKLPERWEAIKCIPFNICFSLGSCAKSLNTNSLVVIKAIVTLLLITGGMISEIAWSKA